MNMWCLCQILGAAAKHSSSTHEVGFYLVITCKTGFRSDFLLQWQRHYFACSSKSERNECRLFGGSTWK
jgi:hypothetical protein